MTGVILGLVTFLFFFILLFLKMPVAIAMTISGAAGLAVELGPTATFETLGKEIYAQFSSYTLSVVPMFVWMGYIAFHSGIGEGLFAFFNKAVGHWRGGLLMAGTMGSAAFGAICGSPTAAVATMGSICYPETQRYNYSPSLSSACIAASGTLSVLIPPSLAFIVYGIQTEQSIGQLFIAGVLPGLLLMGLFIAAIYVKARVDPESTPGRGQRAPWKETLKATLGVIDTLVIFFVVLGGMFLGWFTPTEAGAVGCAAILVVSLVRRRLGWRQFLESVKSTTMTTAMVLLLVFGAQVLGRLIAVTGLAPAAADWLGGIPVPRVVVLAIVLLICVILGFFIEVLSLTLIAVPVFFPLIVDVLGYDPIWFGVIWVLATSTGPITPPVGLQVYIASSVCKVPVGAVFKGIWPFFYAEVVTLFMVVALPVIATFLPRVFSP